MQRILKKQQNSAEIDITNRQDQKDLSRKRGGGIFP